MFASPYHMSFQRIDYGHIFRRLHLDEPNCSNDTLIADILKPVNNKSRQQSNYTAKRSVSSLVDTGAVVTPVSSKTKIPCPITTIWKNKRLISDTKGSADSGVHNTPSGCSIGLSADSSSLIDIGSGVGAGGSGGVCLLRRGKKSSLPLIVKPLANGTAAKLNCTHDYITPLNTTTGSRFFTTRRKFALAAKKAETTKRPVFKRSLSLRENFKYSIRKDSPQDNNLQQDQQHLQHQYRKRRTTSCVTANSATSVVKPLSTHDVVQTATSTIQYQHRSIEKDQGDGPQAINNMADQEQQQSQETEIQWSDIMQASSETMLRECRKLSLNLHGAQSSSATATTLAPSTTSSTTAATKKHSHSYLERQHSPHTRPATLTTLGSAPTTPGVGGGILKTPRSPKSASLIPGPDHNSPIRQQNQRLHNCIPEEKHELQTKKSPGSKWPPRTPPVTPDSPSAYYEDDLDSIYSFTTTSGRSTMSCEHPYVARNGTTFSGRKMKYVVHCSNYADKVGSDYLTPTQRATRQIRRLKNLLTVARQDLEQKDSEMLRLTREVVELRLFKASLTSPEERSASSDAVTVREAELKTSQDVSPIVDMVEDCPQKVTSTTSSHHHTHYHQHEGPLAPSPSPTSIAHHQQHLSSANSQHHLHQHVIHDMQSSFADSGHFEDMTSSSVHSKDSSSSSHSAAHGHHDQACGGDVEGELAGESTEATIAQYELQRQELVRLYEQRIEDLVRNQDAVTSDIKRSNNDRIEALLQKLSECNTRYADIVPDYEHAKERIRELEKLLEDLQRKLFEHEEKQKQMYLHIYQKGQEAERIARADQALELAHRAPENSKVSINELLHQLQSTQDELENIRAAECRKECGSNHALLTAKEAISLWVLGARKTIYRRLLEAQKNRTHVDPEVTLQFLKSAVYYFLTDKENSQGHLQAIESILEFSEAEKQNINKARNAK